MGRPAPIIGMESRLEVGLKSFPLLFKLSTARLTSVDVLAILLCES